MTYSIVRTAAALAIMAGLLGGCGPLVYDVPSTSVAPGADAKIKADVLADHGHTRLDMAATNLMPPERIMQGGQQYVAWYRPNSDAVWTRVGALDYNERKREADLDSSVPATAFDLQVSVESEKDTASPSPTIIFAQRIQDDD